MPGPGLGRIGRVTVFEGFTDRARRVLALAQVEAGLLGHNFIGTEHLLLGIIREAKGAGAKELGALGVRLEAVRQQVAEIVGPVGSPPTGTRPVTVTPGAKKVLDLSRLEASRLGHDFIGAEHRLLGLLREGEGVATQALVGLGVDLSRLRQNVSEAVAAPPGDRYRPHSRNPP